MFLVPRMGARVSATATLYPAGGNLILDASRVVVWTFEDRRQGRGRGGGDQRPSLGGPSTNQIAERFGARLRSQSGRRDGPSREYGEIDHVLPRRATVEAT